MFESSVHVLSPGDMDLIHSSSLELLRDLGVRVDHQRMRDLLADFGCQVENDVVRFPEPVVEAVIEKMRDPANLVDGYVGTLPMRRDRVPKDARVVPVATAQATLAHDLETDKLRPATQQDLADACRVVEALPGAITGHPVYLPQDCPELIRDLYALKVVAQYYPYSDFVEVYSPAVVPYFLEMAGSFAVLTRRSKRTRLSRPGFCHAAFPVRSSRVRNHPGIEGLRSQIRLRCGWGDAHSGRLHPADPGRLPG